ncbi:MAG: hypothetical protein QOJ52_4141, partial [Acidimicrobiaceae bacterium]|nr:hypothetical protein [Acidimicrobiaceae bacterium]
MRDIRLLMTADAAGGIWTYALETARGVAGRVVSKVIAVL